MDNTNIVKYTHRNYGLDLVRALAISIVLAAHFAKKMEVLGFWGVELFFVLSGFLIGQILWRNFNLSNYWNFKHVFNFWSRRWWRTLPNYYLFLLITLVFSYYVYFPMPGSFAVFTKYLWFGQDLVNTNNNGFYSFSWSLCIEEWFYLLFPIFLLLFTALGFQKKQSFLFTFIVFFIASISFRFYLSNAGIGSIRTITLARLDSICCGVVIAYITTVFSLSVYLKRIVFASGILILFISAFLVFYFKIPFQNLGNNQIMLLIVPISASLLLPYTMLLKAPAGKLKLFSVCIEKLSLWSYSIYLSHIPILFTVYFLMNDIRNTTFGNVLSKVVGLTLTITISGLLFKYFELPLTRNRPKEIVAK